MTTTATHNSSIASMNMKLDESESEHHWDNKTSAFGGNGSTNNVFDMSFMTVTDQPQFTPPRNSKEKLTVKNSSDKDALLPPLSPVSIASNPDATAAPHSPVKKTTSGTDTQYDNVTYREETGSLVLNANRIIFQPNDDSEMPKQQKKNSWRWTAIHKQQVSPPRTGKTMLKLVSGESDKKAVTFGLPSREELSRIRRDVAARLQASHNRFPENYSRQSFTNVVSSSGSQGTESTEDESVDITDREAAKEEEEEEASQPIVVAHTETEPEAQEEQEEPVVEDEPAPEASEADEEVVGVEQEEEKPDEEELLHEPVEDEEAEPELEAPELEEESQDHEDTQEEEPEIQETVDEENIEQEIPADSTDLVDYVASIVADSLPAIEPTVEDDAIASATAMMKATEDQLGADDKENNKQEDDAIATDDKESTLEEQAEAAVARGIAAAMDQHLQEDEESGPEPSLLVKMEPEPAAAMEEPAAENEAVVDLEQVYRDLEDNDDDKDAKKEKKNWLESLFGFRLFC